MKILEVNSVSKSFGSKRVLQNVSVKLHRGELVCLLGVSGSGKSTLFNIISGLIPPDSGRVFLKGEDITNRTGRVSYMLQKDLLLPYMKVRDNVSLPCRLKGMGKKEARKLAQDMFARFGLEGTQNLYPAQLSGGLRQRAALLRTYMFSQEVALLDEPFSALDTLTKSDIHRWYLEVMEGIQLSTLFITHDIGEAIMLSDRIYLLGAGGTITGELTVSVPRNQREAFDLSEEFLSCKRKIISMMQKDAGEDKE